MTTPEPHYITTAAYRIARTRLRQPVEPWEAVWAHPATAEDDADALASALSRIADQIDDGSRQTLDDARKAARAGAGAHGARAARHRTRRPPQ